MRNDKKIETVVGTESEPLAIDLSRLLGFQHIAAEAADEDFLEKAAATFNKVGDPGEEPIIVDVNAG